MGDVIRPPQFNQIAQAELGSVQRGVDPAERELAVKNLWEIITNINARNLPFLEEKLKPHYKLLTLLYLPIEPVPFTAFPHRMGNLSNLFRIEDQEGSRSNFAVPNMQRLPRGYYMVERTGPRQPDGDVAVAVRFDCGLDGSPDEFNNADAYAHPALISQLGYVKDGSLMTGSEIETLRAAWYEDNHLRLVPEKDE